MIGSELSAQDKARIAYFEEQFNAIGFDGNFALAPNERGVLAVADLVRAQTMLQVFTVLGIGGRAAADAAFKAVEIDVPVTLADVKNQLRHLYQIS